MVTADMTIPLVVQRDPDQGTPIDEPVVFGLAVTLAMPGEIALYDEVLCARAPTDPGSSASLNPANLNGPSLCHFTEDMSHGSRA